MCPVRVRRVRRRAGACTGRRGRRRERVGGPRRARRRPVLLTVKESVVVSPPCTCRSRYSNVVSIRPGPTSLGSRPDVGAGLGVRAGVGFGGVPGRVKGLGALATNPVVVGIRTVDVRTPHYHRAAGVGVRIPTMDPKVASSAPRVIHLPLRNCGRLSRSAEVAAAAAAGGWPFVGDSTVIWCPSGDTITARWPAAAVASSTI